MQFTFSPDRVAARWYAGKIDESDWPAIAQDALEAGFDGPSLRRLAGLENVSHWEFSKHIEQALEEIGAKKLNANEAFDWCARDICREIVNRTRDPIKCADELWRDMLRLNYYPQDLRHIFDEIELEETGALPGGLEEGREGVIDYAAEYLSLDSRRGILYTSVHFQNASVRLHAAIAGPEAGPVVVLLHGFPEFWYGWRKQIELLANAGFRVVVPDQRGYNLSSKPSGVANYAIPELVSDVIAIADQLGQRKIYLAGHDWGAAVAWSTAILHPERVAKLAVLNVPHPSVMRRYVFTRLRQTLRSWYMFFFQIPWLPEAVFSARSFRMGTRALLRSSRPGAFSDDDLAQYRAAWSQTGALTGMIHWYRAAFRHRVKFPDRMVRVPTRILWGERDQFLLAEMARESLRYCANAELYTFAHATHWIQHEEPALVCEHLIRFFSS